MQLFHGSIIAIDSPQVIFSEHGRDFGNGFYTTDIKEQAVRWAKRKAKIKTINNNDAKAMISIYEFDENNAQKLKTIQFPKPNTEWLDLICACRGNANYQHGYDLLIGKIANDNVGETVSFVLEGIMRKEDALKKLKFEKINNQICFATSKALDFLKYIGFEELK
ncbi:MAG: DUF3990 domain-containing protein [Endomicrobium sp.]|jgi:hypothetical protein|nr:DUF3990 domain-containing protein [Endomicrobium sp.]